MRPVIAVLTLALCFASASAPKAHDVQRSKTIHANRDATWAAVVDVFSDHNWPIVTIDKASGIIATDWLDLGSEADRYADCGGDGITVGHWTRVRFNVRVSDDENDESTVVVNATFRHLRTLGDSARVVDCASTGAVEDVIQTESAVRAGEHVAAARRKQLKAAPDAGVDADVDGGSE